MSEIKKEITPGVYEITRPDGTKIISGKEWSTHIHKGDNFQTVKIEKTGEHIKGVPPDNISSN